MYVLASFFFSSFYFILLIKIYILFLHLLFSQINIHYSFPQSFGIATFLFFRNISICAIVRDALVFFLFFSDVLVLVLYTHMYYISIVLSSSIILHHIIFKFHFLFIWFFLKFILSRFLGLLPVFEVLRGYGK